MGERIDMSRYTLLFNEEFDSLRLYGQPDGLWRTAGYWDQRTLSGNGELQLYVDPAYKNLGLNPFRVADGVLTITAEKASAELKPQIDNLDYTSGMISSERSFSMQYGYYEIRAQMPEGKGLWPAFWMLTADGQWPPELDVVEVLGHEPDKLYGTQHSETADGKHVMDHAVAVKGLFDSSDGFHTFGMDWQADKVVWYYDGVRVGETTNKIFDQPMYMLANLAVGGYWPGNPDGNTVFPAEMKIDYIRAYQKKADHATVGVPTAWDPIGIDAFTVLDGTGAKEVWSWRYTLGETEIKADISGDWARYIIGNDLDNFLAGSRAPYNELVGGKGNDTLYGGGGTDLFIIRDGDGNDTILDLWNVAGNTDKIRLEGFHFTHFDDVKPWLTQVGGDVILRLDQDQAVLLKDKTLGALSPEMFIFTNSVAAPADAPVVTPPVIEPDEAAMPGVPDVLLIKIGAGMTEAEKLSLSGGYRAEAAVSASSGARIAAGGAGDASAKFTGEAGRYTMTVRYVDEVDGAATWAVKVNGVEVKSWTGDGSYKSDTVESRSFNLDLNPGDRITIAGTEDGGDAARVDWFQLRKVDPSAPEPSFAPLGPAIGVGTTEAEKLALSGGFRAEANRSAGSGALIKAAGAGEASGSFTGATDLYKVTVRYLDETDGAGTFAIRVNDEEVQSWTGNAAVTADRFETRTFTVRLETGDKISVVGVQEGGETPRVDWVKVERVPTLGLGVTQADTLKLSGYVKEQSSAAADGTLIKANGNATAEGMFVGEDGSYRLNLGLLNENDGASSVQVKVNGQTVGSWTGHGGSNGIETHGFDLTLRDGDQISIAGSPNKGEYARVDWLELLQQAPVLANQQQAAWTGADAPVVQNTPVVQDAPLAPVSQELVELVGLTLQMMVSS